LEIPARTLLAEEREDSPRIRLTLPRLRWMEREAAKWPTLHFTGLAPGAAA
jgi:hypothetical protein